MKSLNNLVGNIRIKVDFIVLNFKEAGRKANEKYSLDVNVVASEVRLG